MITIHKQPIEYYDSSKNQFEYDDGGVARFEYSLKVVYDWEAAWRKPFLKGEYEDHELMDFYMRMAIDPIDPSFITTDVAIQLSNYIQDTQTATTFSSGQNGQNGNKKSKLYTAEELYALMFSAGVPIEFENRNLNRLMTILRIISSYNNPPKKMDKNEILRQNKSINAQRKAQMKTRG